VEDISRHISELLFDHDCVIVPLLGGFLASNQPASVIPTSQSIYPPYRRIAFNVYLKQNDGLLANHIVESENIAYAEAIRLIDKFTSNCFDVLDNGKKVNISEIGTLYYDKEKNIQFEAFRNFNHLKDSFGMETVHFVPLQREEKTEKRKIEEKTIRPSIPLDVPGKEKEKFISSKGRKYIIVGALGAAAIWFSLNLYMVAPKKYEASSLSPFDSQEITISKSDSLRNSPAPTIIEDTTKNVAVIPVDTASINTDSNPNNISEPVVEASNISKPTIPEPSEEVITTVNSHYVIAGVFKIKENAETLLMQLQRDGFADARIIQANNRSYVAYDGFSRLTDAYSLMNNLQKENLEGWIWKH
jgi:hypothetical protein